MLSGYEDIKPIPNAGNDDYREIFSSANRSSWANEIAYKQWSLDEMKNGDCWDYFGTRLEEYIDGFE